MVLITYLVQYECHTQVDANGHPCNALTQEARLPKATTPKILFDQLYNIYEILLFFSMRCFIFAVLVVTAASRGVPAYTTDVETSDDDKVEGYDEDNDEDDDTRDYETDYDAGV